MAGLIPDNGWIARFAPAEPRLAVRWTKPRDNFFSSLRAVFAGPKSPREFLGAPYFRDCSIASRRPTLAFFVAIVLEAAFLLVANPHLKLSRPRSGAPYGQLTWYMPAADPAPDLPLLSPALRSSKPRARNRAEPPPAPQPETAPGADAYNPRQMIWSQPLKPNHPRQELLEPYAPDMPPKILPVLPNIVQWSDDDSAHLALHLSPAALRRMQPGHAESKRTDDVAAPDIANRQKAADPIDIAASASDAPKPAMVVPAMSRGRAAFRGGQSSASAPEIGPSAATDGGRVIALSEQPGPAAPPPALPKGNLQARISSSPDGHKGEPNGAGSGASATGSRAGSGPAGVGISNRGNLPNAPVAAISGAGGRGSASGASDPRSVPRASNSSAAKSAPASQPSMQVALAPGAPPESLLGTSEVYTLNISMPNLSSAMGNWVLKFAELNAPEYIPDGRARPADDGLSGPVPLRKVDPKYPPELKLEKVEGEVVLYAVIRKDGSVDSIQLIHGLDPELDQNAMEALSRWKFQPAARHGDPVELVAIVHIPFHAPPPEPVY
ncbi:MAG: energy transducer TonB [Candidatus Acidiferrales bacterium]